MSVDIIKTHDRGPQGQRTGPTGTENRAHRDRGRDPQGQRKGPKGTENGALRDRGRGPQGQRTGPTGTENGAHRDRGRGPQGQRTGPSGTPTSQTAAVTGRQAHVAPFVILVARLQVALLRICWLAP